MSTGFPPAKNQAGGDVAVEGGVGASLLQRVGKLRASIRTLLREGVTEAELARFCNGSPSEEEEERTPLCVSKLKSNGTPR